jgi:hypothetical protein
VSRLRRFAAFLVRVQLAALFYVKLDYSWRLAWAKAERKDIA